MQDVSDIDLNSVQELGDDLLDRFAAARQAEPIVWSQASRCWLVLRHADIVEGLRGTLPLSNSRFRAEFVEAKMTGAGADRLPNFNRFVPLWITRRDGEPHKRLRLVLLKALTAATVEAIRPYVRHRVAELLDRVEQRRQVEFVEDVARELPGRVILRLMGLSEDLYPKLKYWATTITTALTTGIPTDQQFEIAESVLAEMTEVFTQVLAERRANPRSGDDFISTMIAATDDGNKLSEDEMIGTLQLIVVAGHDTTTNSMALAVAGLSKRPDQWRLMQEHPEQVANAVQELMRLTAMSTAQNRTATEDFEWHGKQIRRGDSVYLVIASGNRDPLVWDRSDELDVTRNTAPSLVFAPGLHFCIGHLLAKMQLGEFFLALTQRFDGAEVLDTELKFLPPINFRGLDRLAMRFVPRANHVGG
jgi:cytochrome P450